MWTLERQQRKQRIGNPYECEVAAPVLPAETGDEVQPEIWNMGAATVAVADVRGDQRQNRVDEPCVGIGSFLGRQLGADELRDPRQA